MTDNMTLAEQAQFEAEFNDFVDRLDSLDPRFQIEDEEVIALAEEHEEIEFGRAAMGA